jgi:nucleoside-diphosphate-sugar epimerase
VTILVTGATGFVGRHFCERLLADGRRVRCAVRSADRARRVLPQPAIAIAEVGPLGRGTDWSGVLQDVRTVVHLAARAHILEEKAADPLAAFLEVNTDGTLQLARAASKAGAARFIFMSSVKVHGESSGPGAFSTADTPAPVDPYGVSKWRAEQGLAELAQQGRMEVVIVRPPLVYGPGVGANFLRLMRLVDRRIPLPLGRVDNRRSLVSIWNLCDLLVKCLDAPAAANRAFLVSDGMDLSTSDLVKELAVALGKRPNIVNFPVSLLELGARLTGQMAEYTRLCASLRVDISATVGVLGWQPPLTVTESIARTAHWFRNRSDR